MDVIACNVWGLNVSYKKTPLVLTTNSL